MKQRRCPVCDADETRPHWTKGALQLAQCQRCTMVYAHKMDPALASGEFYDRLGASYYLSPDKLQSDYAPVRFARELRLFRHWCKQGEVLDVGCSTGAFLFHLQRAGAYRVTGSDVADAALTHAQSQGIEVLRGPFLDFDFGERRFDAVTFWAVWEHLAEPKLFLRRAAELLRPGGFCFALVPNFRSLAIRVLGVKYRYVMPDHVNYFTDTTLRALVATQPAFELVTRHSTHFNPFVIAQDWRSNMERVPDEQRARLLRQTTALKQNPWLAPLRWLHSGTEKLLGTVGLADNLVIVLRRK